LDDTITDPSSVKRIVLLSGKVYYDLAKERTTRELDSSVALIRIEELCPFPFEALQSALARYTNVQEVFWVQEEPRNQGSFTHVASRIAPILEQIKLPALKFRGRKESAVPAPGVGKTYQAEQKSVLSAAFEGL
jgi:probable 2-oxoglutarate dehydrogenase E1 component DHKTD1